MSTVRPASPRGAKRHRSSLLWGVGGLAVQVAVAVLLVRAPKILLLLVGVGAGLAFVMWALSEEPLRALARNASTDGRTGHPNLAPLPAVWAATLVTFAIFTLDVQGLFTHGDVGAVSPLRYLLLPVPFAVVLLGARNPSDRPPIRAGDVFIMMLLAWGLLASLIFKVGANGAISGLSLFLPMLLVVLPFLRRGADVTEAAARRMLDVFTYLGLGYILIHLAAGVGVPGIAKGAHGHQQGFLLAAALAAAFATNRRTLALVEFVAITAIYLLYPAATYVTTAAAVVVTMLLISPRRSSFRTLVISVSVIAVLVLGFSSSLSSDKGSFANSVLPRYFAAIGKSDNSDFRREMLKLGVEQVRGSPVIGANFTGGFALPTKFRAGRQVVLPHNDYLEIALAGGLVALGLFLGWVAATNIFAIRRHRLLVEAGAEAQAALVWTMLIGFNACLSVALFQPVLFEVGTVVMFFLMYGCVRTTSESIKPVDPAAEPERAAVAR